MSDFCVWLWPGQGVSQASLEKISDAMSSAGTHADRLDPGDGLGLVVLAGTRRIRHFLNDDYLLVVDGTPVWRDMDGMPSLVADDWGESLLRAYLRFGDRLCEHLGGTFALVLIERKKRGVFFAVDRMGIRTLSYAMAQGGGLVLGSSSKAVACHPAVSSAISNQSIYNYLFFHMVPSPDTIFDAVSKLPPAHSGRFAENRITTRRYWCPEFARDHTGTAAAGKKLIASVDEAIRSTTCDREHAACFLSGGLDSSTIAGVMARQNAEQRVDAYTIGFAQEGYDEMEYARCAAQEFGLNLHEHYIQIDDIIDGIETITSAFDEPFGNSSAIPAYFCAGRARADGKTLLLAGDGGDELFGGNERYAKQKVFAAYELIPEPLRRLILEPLLLGRESGHRLAPFRKAASYIEQAMQPMPDRTQSYNFLCRADIADVFPNAFVQSIDSDRPFALMRDEYRAARADSIVDRMLFMDWKFTLADNDLRKVNRSAEAAGVEVAYPLLDDRLVDLSTTIPANRKVRYLTLRHFYKKTLKGFLPEKIINKSKHGFGLPFGEWLLSSRDMRAIVEPAVKNLPDRGILRAEFVEDLLHKHEFEHAAYFGNFVWVLFMLERWLEKNDSHTC